MVILATILLLVWIFAFRTVDHYDGSIGITEDGCKIYPQSTGTSKSLKECNAVCAKYGIHNKPFECAPKDKDGCYRCYPPMW